MALTDRVTDALSTLKLSGFGLAMPMLSPSWASAAMPMFNDDNLTLTLPSGSWLAPLAGTIHKITATPSDSDPPDVTPMLVTLIRPTGQAVHGPGLLITIYPQLYLRLSRLYAEVLERAPAAGSNPLLEKARQQGLAIRPVPRYFFYAGALVDSDRSGSINPKDEVGRSGELTIYDNNGMPIDPLAVASAFHKIITAHPILQKRALGDPAETDPQIGRIAALADSPARIRVWLSDHAGNPYPGTHLTGLLPSQTSGLFRLADGATSIRIEATSGTFTAEQRRLLLIGTATNGKLGDTFTPLALPSGVTLARDFFHLRVVELEKYLLGASTYPDAPDAANKLEQKPAIRTNESLNFLADGNDVLGAASSAIPTGATESLCVAPAIEGNFRAPSAFGVNAHWPNFPAGSATMDDAPLPVNLRKDFRPTATLFDDGNAGTANLDVVLTLNGLPEGAAVRVYPRHFTAEAISTRGDGAGGIVPPSRSLSLLLRDPFSIRELGGAESSLVIPPRSKLSCDVMVVRRSNNRVARLYGNIEVPVTLSPATTTNPTPTDTNRFGAASRRGISRAGIQGLGRSGVSLPTDDPIQAILAMAGEANPRDASRFPTMARRDLLVAGLSAGVWRGVLADGRLTPETHSAESRLGAPGGLGGRETQVVGVSTQHGRLAYDMARMAFRRTTNIFDRLRGIAPTQWVEPPALTSGGSNAGTFAGAILQTIAPFCETPELSFLASVATPESIPATFAELVNWVKARLGELIPSATPFRRDLINAINSKLDQLLREIGVMPQNQERLYGELKRELASSIHGRRDAQWALAGAIEKARRFIYIESPGFVSTQKNYAAGTAPAQPYFVNLIEKIKNRLDAMPGLHVMICTPKFPDYGRGYESIAEHEAVDRWQIFDALLPQDRVVAFHSIGFPGRPSRLESTVVIVDDVWALIGSSAFRRRGLTFDGGSDIVLTDTELLGGASPALVGFRRRLMADRLGVNISTENEFGAMPEPNFVRLRDGVEAFYLIREMLIAGGLGKMDRLYHAPNPSVELSMDLTNPDGKEFNLTEAVVREWVSRLGSY